MSGDVDYPLKAVLENELVLKRLVEMEKAADKVAQSAVRSRKVLGQAIQTVTNELRDSVEAGKETGRVYASIFGEGGKTFKQPAAEVQPLKTAVNELTKGLSETAKTDKIKEPLTVQDANQRMQQLKVTLDALFDSGNSVVLVRELLVRWLPRCPCCLRDFSARERSSRLAARRESWDQ
jgi:predicted transcriptional regulator